ncbi:MAG: preprotein translocase subunit SecE [Bacillota bacterium]|nr:preprotein translocase subunit SecE [Bacillota bacterium]
MAREQKNKPVRRQSGRQPDPRRGSGRPSGPQRPRRKGILGIWDRLLHFLADLRAELKRVVWPNKQRMIQSSAVVFAIVIAAALLIGVVDFIVRNSLIAAGFDMPRTLQTETETPRTTAAPEVTDLTETESAESSSEATESETEESGETEESETTAEGTEGT